MKKFKAYIGILANWRRRISRVVQHSFSEMREINMAHSTGMHLRANTQLRAFVRLRLVIQPNKAEIDSSTRLSNLVSSRLTENEFFRGRGIHCNIVLQSPTSIAKLALSLRKTSQQHT